jgi:hypothetical protein
MAAAAALDDLVRGHEVRCLRTLGPLHDATGRTWRPFLVRDLLGRCSLARPLVLVAALAVLAIAHGWMDGQVELRIL